MRKFIGTLVSVILVAVLGFFGLSYLKHNGPRERVQAPDGSKIAVEELSFYIHGSKMFGRVYKKADKDGNLVDSTSAKPLVIFFHEPLKTDWPESVVKALVPSGVSGYLNGFRGKASDAVSLVRRISRESFVEPDMIFLIADPVCGDAIVQAAAKLGSRIQGLVLIEPTLTGKSSELYMRYGKEFLTIDAASKGNAVHMIEDYLEERGALK